MAIQAVFWDFDNTLVLTEQLHWEKHQQVLAAHGILLEERFRQRVYENNGRQNWLWMSQEIGLMVPQAEYLQAIDAFFHASSTKLLLRPGVAEVLAHVQSRGISQAIVTNARRSSALPTIEKKKIGSYFEFVLCKEDYEGRKPDPAPYLTALTKMSQILNRTLQPACCIAVEDDPKGVESAYRAGLITVYRKMNQEQPETPYAHYSCFEEEAFQSLMRELTHSI